MLKRALSQSDASCSAVGIVVGHHSVAGPTHVWNAGRPYRTVLLLETGLAGYARTACTQKEQMSQTEPERSLIVHAQCWYETFWWLVGLYLLPVASRVTLAPIHMHGLACVRDML